MNASIYTPTLNFNVPTVNAEVIDMPKVNFDTISVGNTFLRIKNAKAEVFMKIGKRSAMLLLNCKGETGSFLKFKETNKVLPLDTELVLSISKMTYEGRDDVEALRRSAFHATALVLPKAKKPLKPLQAWAASKLEEDARNRLSGTQQSSFNN